MSKKNKKNQPQINYLDLIPEKAPSIKWHRDLKEKSNSGNRKYRYV